MVFSSIFFLFGFLPIFLIIYHFIDERYKNHFALLSSLFFYTWGAPNFISIAILSIVADFFIVSFLSKSEGKNRLYLLWSSILLNLSFLLYFKYTNFFIENLNSITSLFSGREISMESILLPIGISFYTFQKISYSVDIYRRIKKPLDSIVDYTLYILLFPQLIAGPIVRFNEIADQLHHRDSRNYDDKINGFYRFSIGLAKKVLIANEFGVKADFIFSLPTTDLSTSEAWIGILCYTFQIYFDFSGYSDMAIGLGRMMGFKFPENFNSPYLSKNISEFWRRWHITLGSWMRDYLYIPLGGNQSNKKWRVYFNLCLVFIISGFWHGAAWTFILWGAFHGVFLITDRLFLNQISKEWPSWTKIVLTFFITVNGWVLFRSESLPFALDFYNSLYSFNFIDIGSYLEKKFLIITILALIISFGSISKIVSITYDNFLSSVSLRVSLTKVVLSIFLMLLASAQLVSSSFNPFIYFRF